MAAEPVPQPQHQSAEKLVGGVQAVEHRHFAAPERRNRIHRRGLRRRGRDVAEKSGPHSMKWHRAAIAFQKGTHLVVGRGRRQFRLRHGGSGLMLFFCSAYSYQCVAVMPNGRARHLMSSMTQGSNDGCDRPIGLSGYGAFSPAVRLR
jgi:hypothetical protein